jgi:hypothetical protein
MLKRALAYFATTLVTKKKSFITFTPVVGHFTHVGYSRNIIKQHLQCQRAEVNFGKVQ